MKPFLMKDHKVDAITGRREVCKLNYDFLLSCCSSKEVEDYSISATLASELPPVASATKKTRTVGIVEPRVVVKIPWTKIGRKTQPQENSATKQMHTAPDATNAIKTVYQSDDVSNANTMVHYQHPLPNLLTLSLLGCFFHPDP